MNWDDMVTGLVHAEHDLRRADLFIDRMVKFLLGRLRKVSSHDTLRLLKRELSEYNASTREWKS